MRSAIALAAALTVVAACAGPQNGKAAASPNPDPFLHAPSVYRASAGLADANGKAVGTVHFAEERQMVRVDVRLVDLAPGDHGVHIHATGRCEAPAFTSAGAHFNPANKAHGKLSPNGPHAGDLGNVTVGSDRRGAGTFFTPHLSTNPAASNSVLLGGGLSVVVHAQADDDKTDPSGNSGDRVACGVVRALPLPL